MSGWDLGLSEEHQAAVAAFLRFTRYQRGQRLRSVDACFHDVKDTRLLEDTYTSEEVSEMLDSLAEVVRAEVEGELIHAVHTHSLLLSRLFQQAQKWHLALTVDTTDLENQELLEEIKKFEERENQPGLSLDPATTSPNKNRATRLAPLTQNDGPIGLLQAEMKRLTADNSELKVKLEQAQEKVAELSKMKTEVSMNLQSTQEELKRVKLMVAEGPSAGDVTELSDEVEMMRLQLGQEAAEREASEEELAHNLTTSRQTLLQVKAQLQLAEKELEKKFSQTGAYQNMKKMLNKKNEQIKSMRKKLEVYEPSQEETTEE
ncbi:hypothetical protein Pcinc_012788 [Petrolisthes cinctipes]|uniref:Leucine zipper transcription factor-like protein 1 n=1 Tax=Petrolisthes cinctipes TaxID=88211 RepID=A0AAE1FYM9_PETCI|nr:hypothetical protein Pcinc_012788 [Petrolisthes cinctipes]